MLTLYLLDKMPNSSTLNYNDIKSLFDPLLNSSIILSSSPESIIDYVQKTLLPDSSMVMLNEIESLFIYLLQLAEQNNVDMDRVINTTNETGLSLFHLGTLFSEKVSLELIKRNVKVNRITSVFVTPSFKVR